MNLMATVAGDLRAVATMHERLLTEAVHSANDRLLPGGKAMVELAYVASPSRYQWQVDYLERVLDIHPDLSADDDDWEPPLQTLCFWSDQWRVIHDKELGTRRATVATETNFLRWCLDWAWDNEPHFEDFARDVAAARRRVEDTLSEGERAAFRGGPCMYESCRGRALIRKTVPTRDKDGNKVYRLSDWHCPKCKRSWSEEDYIRNVYAAVLRTKVEQIDGEAWCTVDLAAARIGRPGGTLRSWITRGQVDAVCMLDGRRTFVRYTDVVERDRLATERRLRWLRAIATKRCNVAVATTV